MSHSFKRRNYFIDKAAQGRFMAGFALASILAGLVAVFCFRHLAANKLSATLYSMRLPDISMGELLMEEMGVTSLVTICCVVLLFSFTALKIFARIDGPLKKMVNSVHNIAGGDLQSEVKLRDNDEFRHFAAEVDLMARQMNGRFGSIKKHAESIRELSGNIDGEKAIDITALQSHLAAMKKEVQAFTL